MKFKIAAQIKKDKAKAEIPQKVNFAKQIFSLLSLTHEFPDPF